MPSLKPTFREIGSVTIVDLSGELVLGQSGALRVALGQLMDNRRTKIILNLANVKAIDSSGIGELAGAYTPVRTRGGEMKLLNPTKKVDDMLKLTQLSRVFEVYTDEASALRGFGQSS